MLVDGGDLSLHCIALHCIALHCIALHCIALHSLHCIAFVALHCIRCIALRGPREPGPRNAMQCNEYETGGPPGRCVARAVLRRFMPPGRGRTIPGLPTSCGGSCRSATPTDAGIPDTPLRRTPASARPQMQSACRRAP